MTDHSWKKVWLFCALLVGILSGGLEWRWRALGHRPSVHDDENLWSLQRERVVEDDGRTVVLLGASKIKLGFDADVFYERYPDRQLVQLAVLGGDSCMAPLVDLADEARFRGLAVCSLAEHWLSYRPLNRQQSYVDYFHRKWRLEKRIDRKLQTTLQQRLTLILPRISVHQHFHFALSHPERLQPHYINTAPDRTSRADLRGLAGRATMNRIVRLPGPPANWPDQRDQIRDAIRKIQGRGGQVVFVRFPDSEARWRPNNDVFPREYYWDRLTSLFGVPTIHFLDLTGGEFLECPDGEHLDYRDAPRFTQLLLDALAEMELLGPASSDPAYLADAPREDER